MYRELIPYQSYLQSPNAKLMWAALIRLNTVPRRELHRFNLTYLSPMFRLPLTERKLMLDDFRYLKVCFLNNTVNDDTCVVSKSEMLCLLDLGCAYLSIKDSTNRENIDKLTDVINRLKDLNLGHSNAAVISHNNRGTTYNDSWTFDEAIKDFSVIIDLNPFYGLAWYNRGLAHQRAKMYDEAIRDYSEAIRIDGRYEDAYNNRGNCYYEQEQYEQAIEDYNRILEFNPSSENALFNRGLSYKYLGYVVLATRDFVKASQLQPQDKACRAELESSREFIKERGSDYCVLW
jgi:tetratricopeptide (TPR) repeat protein